MKISFGKKLCRHIGRYTGLFGGIFCYSALPPARVAETTETRRFLAMAAPHPLRFRFYVKAAIFTSFIIPAILMMKNTAWADLDGGEITNLRNKGCRMV